MSLLLAPIAGIEAHVIVLVQRAIKLTANPRWAGVFILISFE